MHSYDYAQACSDMVGAQKRRNRESRADDTRTLALLRMLPLCPSEFIEEIEASLLESSKEDKP